MGWLPFTSDKPAVPSGQVIQRSHTQITTPELSQTLHQISGDNNVNITESINQSDTQINSTVSEFVAKKPNNVYIIDGERDTKESIICTANESGGKTCLKLQYNSIQLFKQMQKLEYFCSLPDDIDATYFECRKIQ